MYLNIYKGTNMLYNCIIKLMARNEIVLDVNDLIWNKIILFQCKLNYWLYNKNAQVLNIRLEWSKTNVTILNPNEGRRSNIISFTSLIVYHIYIFEDTDTNNQEQN